FIELIWPFLAVFTRLGWRGGAHLPAGGCLLVANHVSFCDPMVDTAFVLAHGRVPRYLAKADLWRMPVVRRALAGGGHIPVELSRFAGLRPVRGVLDEATAAIMDAITELLSELRGEQPPRRSVAS